MHTHKMVMYACSLESGKSVRDAVPVAAPVNAAAITVD